MKEFTENPNKALQHVGTCWKEDEPGVFHILCEPRLDTYPEAEQLIKRLS